MNNFLAYIKEDKNLHPHVSKMTIAGSFNLKNDYGDQVSGMISYGESKIYLSLGYKSPGMADVRYNQVEMMETLAHELVHLYYDGHPVKKFLRLQGIILLILSGTIKPGEVYNFELT